MNSAGLRTSTSPIKELKYNFYYGIQGHYNLIHYKKVFEFSVFMAQRRRGTEAQRHKVKEDNKKCQEIRARSENILWSCPCRFDSCLLCFAPLPLCHFVPL
jgi:hypothetical protein